jgi:adenylate kinase
MMEVIPVIILLGAPGAGKGTQASYLSRVKSIPKISTGDMLRGAVQEDSDLGRKVKEIMNDGGLVDDETMLNLVAARIAKPDCEKGFVLDGYPRNIHQAQQFEKVLKPHMKLCVVEIEVSEDEIVKRVAGRRTCPSCQRIYNIHFQPPAKDGTCDFDGSKLFARLDDQEKVVRRRLATYRKETRPLLNYYGERGVLRIVNGVQPVEEVARQISERIEC